jgi:hypothetical protein
MNPCLNCKDVKLCRFGCIQNIKLTTSNSANTVPLICSHCTKPIEPGQVYLHLSHNVFKHSLCDSNTSLKENVIHPDHYNAGKVECIDALEAATVNLQGIEAFYTANIIKYMWRWKQKNGIEDLKKAEYYIQWLMKHIEKEGK